MEQFLITDEEKQFIVIRRELAAKRKKSCSCDSKHPVKKAEDKPKDAVLGTNRPQGWDSHCKPCQVHKGRITEQHPLFWFEEEIFKKITNMQHKDQHKKIKKLLGLPIQNLFRDRQYHALAHLEALWQQEMLPLRYKIKAEEYKAQHGIGIDFVHPEHKKQKPDYKYPTAKIKRPWDAEKYTASNAEKEQFVAGKKYRYAYDDEIEYKFANAYKEELA